ncbi:MAG: cation:proton antiporter [Leptolyngbya sp. IPPAS B-1204]|nr:sodium:proton antiporter [Elainella sp. C42_A2020_010]
MSIDSHIWDFLVIGLLLLGVTLGSSWITRLPLSYALIYLIAGIFLGPYGFGIIDLSPDAEFLERLTEIVVIVSLFACGIKMNRPLNPWAWHSTVRLIGLLMPLTIGAIALLAHFGLGYDWGAAILLGAILAPTDPVLASEVQLTDTDDHNELRFGLTSEGGLNDALAFPFVYFGLYWLKDNQWDNWFKSWVAVDLIWAITAGIAGGIVVARIINALSKRLRRTYGVEEEMEDLIALATILITYALTEAINGYGFLAVFVAGVFVRRSRSLDSEEKTSQLHFTGLMERLLEVGTILLVGAMLRIEPVFTYGGQTLLIAGALIFLIRPIATWISTIGDNLRPTTRLLFGWFGIRGVGSLYYLTYALSDGIPDEIASPLSWITFFTVTLSVIIHGISATPLMNWYEKRFGQENRLEPETLEEEVDREADMD